MSSSRLPSAIIVARCSSLRLPGKVLRQVTDRPMIRFVIEKVGECGFIDKLCVATSTDSSDDALAAYCHSIDLPCIRGPLDDVASRTLIAAEALGTDQFFRVNGDSPLLGIELFTQAWQRFQEDSPDIVTNIQPRTFPPGASVELISTAAMRRAVSEMTAPEDREHVTRYFYTHPDRFRISNIQSDRDYSGVHLAVDTQADFDALVAVVQRMERPHWDYSLSQTVDLYREVTNHG